MPTAQRKDLGAPLAIAATDDDHARMHTRRVIGAMTGTSIDGIDLALVQIDGAGLDMHATLLRGRSAELGALAPRLRAAAEQVPLPAREFAALALEFGALHAREATALAAGDSIDLVVAHGQTVFHAPPVSWQLLNPFPIAAALRCRVVCDLRQADLIAGGQGAPITPLADWILFRAIEPRVILNLGGFANVTALPGHSAPLVGIRGADLCVCNQLLDRAARHLINAPFDRDGATAARGRADASLCRALAQRLAQQRAHGRSLGTGDELFEWLESATRSLSAEDTLATAVAALAVAIASGVRAIEPSPSEVIVAGGGARHRSLLAAIAVSLGCPVVASDDRGVPADWREAMEMAVLGSLAEDGVPISLPSVTLRGTSLSMDGIHLAPARLRGPHDPMAAPRTHHLPQ